MPPDALLSRRSRSPRSRPAGAALWAPLLDRGAAAPLSRQLAAALRTAIAEGRLGAGARLPSTRALGAELGLAGRHGGRGVGGPGARLPSPRALAAELGLARSTVVAVFEQLAAEGYIAAQPGSGYFVPASLVDAQPRESGIAAGPAARST